MDHKFSCCTFIKNAKEIDVEIELWIKHHCSLFDEVVVADTGSTDGTLDILKGLSGKYDNLKVVYRVIEDKGNNKWFRDCKNFAIKMADNDAIIFLDADEYLHEAFLPRVYGYINAWNSGAKINGACLYKQFVGNLFSEASGWNYVWQVRIFRKDMPYKISIDGANFVNKDFSPNDRPQIFLYHYGYVKDKKKQTKKVTVQTLRHDDHAGSIEAGKMKVEDCNPYNPVSILLDCNIVKHIGGFPKIVADNPAHFYRYAIDDLDEELFKFLWGKKAEEYFKEELK